MTLPASGNPISARDIANEFGYTHSPETRLGSYRTTNGQGNFPVSFGALQFNSIDAQTGGSVPTSGQIKFSDFYGTKLQTIVNFYGSGRGGSRLVAKDRYNAGGSNDVNVVGNYRTRPNNSSGTKVHIHVNQQIGSEKTRVEHCALRTGSWDSSTTLQVDVGGSGRIGGAGGDGGRGSDSSNGNSTFGRGGDGTSGLGVQYNPTTVNVASGGVITAGFGGGGGGGGAYDTDKEGARTASGGGGGGGAGIPAGAGGAAGFNAGVNGGAGSAGSVSEGGAGGNGGNNAGEAVAGDGGTGGEASAAAGSGVTGQGGEGSTYSPGPAGSPGAAIRRNTGFTVNVNIASSGSVNGVQNATTVL